MNTVNVRAAALAVLFTAATLGSLGVIANSEHHEAVAHARQQPAVVVASRPQVLQVVIIGRRLPA